MAEAGDVTALIRLGDAVRDDALEEIKERIITRARLYMPAHDPIRDPDPAINLAERIFVYVSGGVMRIVVDTEYAAKQHEAMWFDHPRGGGPKYLERALLETIPEMDAILQAALLANLKSGAVGRSL